jgi:putative transposase
VPIAPRTYFAHIVGPPSKRALWDMSITEILAGFDTPDERGRRCPESLYGSLKRWAHLAAAGCAGGPDHGGAG